MKTRYTVALSMIAGAALGGAALQGLHAQAKLEADSVGEIEVTDASPSSGPDPVALSLTVFNAPADRESRALLEVPDLIRDEVLHLLDKKRVARGHAC